MTHIQNRHDLLNLAGRCPRKTIQRLVELDRVECLGLFSQTVPGDSRKAWLFNVAGYKGKHYIVAALMYRHDVSYRILKKVPWHYWDGGIGLKGGDHPGRYALKRADTLRENTNDKTDAGTKEDE